MQLTTSTSGRKWTKWWTVSVVYAISFLLYSIACLRYGLSEMCFEIGGLVFSIIPAYIALFWSLDEARKDTKEQIETLQKLTSRQISALKDSTKLQVESFSTQCQGIVFAIEKVVGTIAQNSEDVRKRAEQEEKRLEEIQRLTENHLRILELEAQKDFEEKQRIAPRVFVQIADEPWWFLFRHYQLYVYNSGGNATNIELTFFFFNPSYETTKKTVSIGSLARKEKSRSIDCGDVTALSVYTTIQVSVSLRDKKERLYVGNITIDKTKTEWVQIPLEERR